MRRRFLLTSCSLAVALSLLLAFPALAIKQQRDLHPVGTEVRVRGQILWSEARQEYGVHEATAGIVAYYPQEVGEQLLAFLESNRGKWIDMRATVLSAAREAGGLRYEVRVLEAKRAE